MERARVIESSEWMSCEKTYGIIPSHLAVPVLRFGVDGTKNLHVPFAAAPRLDDLRGDDIHENLRKEAAFGVAFEVVGRLLPREVRIEHHREKQIVSIVDDDELTAGPLQRRVVDQVFFGAVGADVALQRKLARDGLLDGDLPVPAVAAVLLLAARLGDLLGAAQRAPRLRH